MYADLPPDVRPAAQNLLASRPAWSLALLKLVEAGTIKPAEVPVDLVDRLRAQQDERVSTLTQKLFAVAPPTSQEMKRAEVLRVRAAVEGAAGDPYKGEAIFMQRCAACHTLFFKGGQIGPNLTTYQRDDLSTMLPSIVDPNAEVREGYENYLVRTKDGRTLGGFLTESDATIVALRGFDGQDVRLPRTDVKDLRNVGTSLMPEGLLDGLTDEQLRDFFAYLRIPQPITG
jgi:putative heme-binding domain-containing protein